MQSDRKKNRGFAFSIVSILLLILLVGCGQGSAPSDVNSQSEDSTKDIDNSNQPGSEVKDYGPGITDNKIVLGTFGAKTGPIAFIGEEVEDGLRSYFEHVNNSGGINGRSIELLMEDDEYQPPKAVAAARKLVEQDQVFSILAPIGTPNVVATLPFLEEQGVPVFAPYTPLRELTNPKREYIFAILPDYYSQMVVLTEYLIDEGFEKFVMLYQDDQVGAEGLSAVEDVFDEQGLQLASQIPMERDVTDFSSYVLSAQEENPDVILVMSTSVNLSKILNEAKKYNVDIPFATYSSGSDPQVAELAGDAANGLFTQTVTSLPNATDEGMEQYLSILQEYDPSAKVGHYTMFGYAAAKAIVDVLEECGDNLTRENFIKTAESMGEISLDIMPNIQFSTESHAGSKSVEMVTWENGQVQPLTDWIE